MDIEAVDIEEVCSCQRHIFTNENKIFASGSIYYTCVTFLSLLCVQAQMAAVIKSVKIRGLKCPCGGEMFRFIWNTSMENEKYLISL